MSDYSDDAQDFLRDYKKKTQLQEHQDIIKDFGEQYERSYQMLNTFYAEAYKDQSYYLGKLLTAQYKVSLIDMEARQGDMAQAKAA